MKTRNGFVSNSSSSSFIVKCATGRMSVDFCKHLLESTWGYINLENVDMNALAQRLYDNMEEYTGQRNSDYDWVPISEKEVKEYNEKGYTLYEVWLSDHSSDVNGIFLPDEILDKLPHFSDGILECCWGWDDNAPAEVIEYKNQH